MSCELHIVRYTMQSSAKSLVFDDTCCGRSLMNARNSIGPRTLPCGTPLITASGSGGRFTNILKST